MSVSSVARHAALAACVLASVPAILSAQDARGSLLDSARVLVDGFNERQSIALLQRALNPALGAPDSMWSDGVQLLAQILTRNGQADEAVAWMRWALRISPAMVIDSVRVVPSVVSAFQAARQFVADAPVDPRATVGYEWATARNSGQFGDVRVAQPAQAGGEPLLVALDGGGFLDVGQPRRLAPGTYRFAARAAGAPEATVSAEVLPGVTTVLTFSFTSATSELATGVRQRIAGSMWGVQATRSGETSCSGSAIAAGPGLLLSTYQAIRGAESLSLRNGDGRESGNVRVAAYDVSSDLALLAVDLPVGEPLPLSLGIQEAVAAWAARSATCGGPIGFDKVSVEPSGPELLALPDTSPAGEPGSILIDASGAIAGVLTLPRRAIPGARIAVLLESARRALATDNLLTLRDVAVREKHAYGLLALASPIPGARVRISPLDVWQWSDAARTSALPYIFRGPMGRYSVEMLDTNAAVQPREVVLEPYNTLEIVLGPPITKKGRSKLLPILGGLAAGGVVAILVGGGKTDPPATGGIRIQLPQ